MKIPELTLEAKPEPTPIAEPILVTEPTPETEPGQNALDVRPASTELQNLGPEEQKAVREFAQKINLSDPAVVMQYGAAAQTKIAQFSDSVLQNVRTNQMGAVGKSLTDLVVEIKSFDSQALEERGGILGKLGGFKRRMEKMAAGYSKVETNINKIQSELEGHQRQLMKDIHTLNILYDKNQEYFKELTMYIAAGEEKLDQFFVQEVPVQRQKAESTGDQMEAQILNDMMQLADRFEKKLHDLKLSRTISIQMAPQIRLLQNNDGVLLEKIQSSIVNSIPLWKNQMVLAVGMANSRAALAAQTKVTDMTNTLLQKNSEMLRQGTVDIAQEAERGIVSIDTIKKSNENLIATISEVLQIQEQGRQDRTQAEGELVRIEGELKEALMQASTSRS